MHAFICTASLTVIVLSASAPAQAQILYYKFDRGLGSQSINYGSAAVSSTMVTAAQPTSAWVSPGKYGPAMLRGSSNTSSSDAAFCDTGFMAGFNGSFTLHWWMKQRNPVGTKRSYVFGGPGALRCFTNGIAGTSLWVRGFSQTTVNIVMPTDGLTIQARATAPNGVCVGVVVQQSSPGLSTAQWYVDGVKHGAAQPLLATGHVVPDPSSLRIGKHTDNAFSSVWDIDEFRLCNFAATTSQIVGWCAAPSAAVGPLGTQCGVDLDTTGGQPKLGNAALAYAIQATPAVLTTFLLVIGVNPGLPFDMGMALPGLSGCSWYTSFDNQLMILSDNTGKGVLASPVPANSSFAGAHFELQTLGQQGSVYLQSNMLSLVIEAN